VRSKWVVIPYFVAHREGCIQALRDSRLQAYKYQYKYEFSLFLCVRLVPELEMYKNITLPRIFG